MWYWGSGKRTGSVPFRSHQLILTCPIWAPSCHEMYAATCVTPTRLYQVWGLSPCSRKCARFSKDLLHPSARRLDTRGPHARVFAGAEGHATEAAPKYMQNRMFAAATRLFHKGRRKWYLLGKEFLIEDAARLHIRALRHCLTELRK